MLRALLSDSFPSAAPASLLRKRSATLLLFGLLALLVACYALLIDRTFLLDQQNYLEDFAEAATLNWAQAMFNDPSLLRAIIVQTFSEEILWQVWATLLGTLFDPTTAVLITVCLLNLFVIAAAERTPGPTLALVLWFALPVGLCVVGLIQLRQGFAFGVMLFFALRLRRPILGTLIAAMLHTTFVVAFVFVVVERVFRSRPPVVALAAAVLVAFTGAYAGSVLFDMFGGRRVLTYSVNEGATSINYVYGGILCILPSVYWLLTSRRQELHAEGPALNSLAVIHIGATAFVAISFFIFPLGTGRVGYLSYLLLIPILPAVLFRRVGSIALGVSGVLLLYVVYLATKAIGDGTYDVYLGF
jgi:hypothetical protein